VSFCHSFLKCLRIPAVRIILNPFHELAQLRSQLFVAPRLVPKQVLLSAVLGKSMSTWAFLLQQVFFQAFHNTSGSEGRLPRG
jgi:hypothetical protein